MDRFVTLIETFLLVLIEPANVKFTFSYSCLKKRGFAPLKKNEKKNEKIFIKSKHFNEFL